jgi:hypothetical protein
LQLLDNPFLSDLSAISGLTSLVTLVIGGNDVLANLDSLSGLTAVTGDINIINNPVLTDISGLIGASGFQSLDIRQNPLLTSLDGLQGGQGETNLTGLILDDNDSLTNVDPLLGLASVGNLNPEVLITDNDGLTNLDGLASLISVDADFTVRNNPLLSECSALSTLLDGVDDGDPGPGPGVAGIPDVNGDVTISFNQTGCNSIGDTHEGPALRPFEFFPAGAAVQGVILDVEGVASDVGRGDSNVVIVEYSVDGGAFTAFTPVDGSFDSPTEAFHALLDTSTLSVGGHTICARAEDALGNASMRCIPLEIVEGAVDGEWMVICRHVPLWPQPGETVEIRMLVTERSEGNEQVANFPADRMEIWLDDPAMPIAVEDQPGNSFFSHTSDVLAEGNFTYGCRAKVGAESIFSGWRTVFVGDPAPGPIRVTYTGPSSQRMNVVFIADVDDYPTGPSDPQFLGEVNKIIRDSYYEYGYFNRYQHLINFYLARFTGDAERSGPEADADRTIDPPSDWEMNYSFADAGAVVHADSFREFAKDGFFTIEVGERANTTSHETGHRPFGLSDEYCCNTGYYQNSPLPNVYETLGACEADAPNLGRTAEDCRTWDKLDDMGDPVSTWYSSEPDIDDMMNSGQTPPQAADKRRIDWWFETCRTDEDVYGC